MGLMTALTSKSYYQNPRRHGRKEVWLPAWPRPGGMGGRVFCVFLIITVAVLNCPAVYVCVKLSQILSDVS